MTAVMASGTLVALAMVCWPVRERVAQLQRVLRAEAAIVDAEALSCEVSLQAFSRESRAEFAEVLGDASGPEARPEGVVATLRFLWRADPVALLRERRERRSSGSGTDGILAILEGVAPALEAGLPPAVAVRLAGQTLGTRVDAATAQLVAHLTRAAEAGRPLAPAWRSHARRTGSPEVEFVAAAWQLSEVTGSPLADAVQRAVVSLRQARDRKRRVHVAVAGPRATVVVLTVLPLGGPVFGLACGVTPDELYLSNAIGGSAAVAGLGLIWLGRSWCRRLVESVAEAGAVGRAARSRGVRVRSIRTLAGGSHAT